MTIKPRAMRAFRDARERLRDVAAASHSMAAAASAESSIDLDQEHDTLDQILDGAPDALSSARTVHDLDQVGEITAQHRLAVATAAARHSAAVAATEAAADRLRERARQMRTAERLVERLDREHDDLERRAEQRGCDDMSARRR